MSEKTEQPTPQRLRKAREDGQIAKSKDFTEVVLMGALVGYTLVASGKIMTRFGEMIAMPGQLHGVPFRDAMPLAVGALTRAGIEVLLPFIGLVVLVALLTESAQTGMLISFKALIPKGERLDPVANLKQMFSPKNLVDFLKSCLKLTILSVLVYLVVRDSLGTMVKIPLAGVAAAGSVLAQMMWVLFVKTFIAFAAIAIFDLVWQRHSHTKSLMMSMDEIKQEHKQTEGDPHMKGHRKEMAREIAMGDAVEHTKDANLVVTNPTHLAIALLYETGKTPLPVVLAKGEGTVAEAMKRVAEREGIPVMQDIPLARGLMRRATTGQYIPSEFIEPVANVLLALRRLQQEREMEQEDQGDDF